jgi:hypothetical protein
MRSDGRRWRAGTGALLVGVVLGAAGCASVRMVPPADVAAESDVFEATDRSTASGFLVDESFVLGPYRVAEVDRQWTSARRSGGRSPGDEASFAHFSEAAENGYSFRFGDGEEALAAQCAVTTLKSGVEFGKDGSISSKTSRLMCVCGTPDASVKLELENASGTPTGRLTLPRGTLALTVVREINGPVPMTKAGFRADLDGRPLGAVEVLHPGRIWLSRSLDDTERRQLGCLFAALMLYDDHHYD